MVAERQDAMLKIDLLFIIFDARSLGLYFYVRCNLLNYRSRTWFRHRSVSSNLHLLNSLLAIFYVQNQNYLKRFVMSLPSRAVSP